MTRPHFWTNFACIPHRYLYESHGVRRGMWTLSWFLDLLGDEVAERAASLGLSREQYLEREAEAVPAGSDGLMTVLDWLAPTDRPFRKGMMLGFDARHTRAHVYRSILEAIALTMKHNVDAMCRELGISLEEIVVSGGGATSDLFMRIFADCFGIPRLAERGGRWREPRRRDLRGRGRRALPGHRDRGGEHGRRSASRSARTPPTPPSTSA